MVVGYNLFKDVMLVKFPSPYGVIFILIYGKNVIIMVPKGGFPSPYGVSFILIQSELFIKTGIHVSVSLRSYIHSYLLEVKTNNGEHFDVSVSLWSIIHSYANLNCVASNIKSFRLLMEYHSFLFL